MPVNKLSHKLHQVCFLFVKLLSKKYIHGELVIDNQLKYEGQAIYAVNHTNVSDIPVVFHTLNKQIYVLAGTKSQKLIDKTYGRWYTLVEKASARALVL